MIGNSRESVVQGITDTPWEHYIEDFVHRAGQHRPNRCGEHSKTLKDRSFEGCVLSASLPQMIFDSSNDIVQVRSHSTSELHGHVSQGDVGCLLVLDKCADIPISRSVGLWRDCRMYDMQFFK
jgi:hypothetical protein